MRLTPREIIITVAGLIVGLFFGVLLESEADLFGTAGGDKKSADFAYYLIELDQTEAWLTAKYPASTEKFQASVSVLTRLPGLWGAPADFEAAKADVDLILPYTYAALKNVDEAGFANYKADPNNELATCLGVDDNPYDGATMYLYVTVPQDDVEKLDIPKEWDEFKIKRPKTNTMYWKLVACYPTVEETN